MKKSCRSSHVTFDILNHLSAYHTAVSLGLAGGGGSPHAMKKHGPGFDSCLLEGGWGLVMCKKSFAGELPVWGGKISCCDTTEDLNRKQTNLMLKLL